MKPVPPWVEFWGTLLMVGVWVWALLQLISTLNIAP